jgi:hypothetical protein
MQTRGKGLSLGPLESDEAMDGWIAYLGGRGENRGRKMVVCGGRSIEPQSQTIRWPSNSATADKTTSTFPDNLLLSRPSPSPPLSEPPSYRCNLFRRLISLHHAKRLQQSLSASSLRPPAPPRVLLQARLRRPQQWYDPPTPIHSHLVASSICKLSD